MPPVEGEGCIIDTQTCIRMIHELNTFPACPPSRNDSTVGRPSSAEIAPWQTLFGFTAADAEIEWIKHRTAPSTHEACPETLAQWPWERCQALGFDVETYRYWLRMTEQHNIVRPRDTANVVRNVANSWALFVFMPVDKHIYRLKCVPEIQRPTDRRTYTVYDYEGTQHNAMVMRA